MRDVHVRVDHREGNVHGAAGADLYRYEYPAQKHRHQETQHPRQTVRELVHQHPASAPRSRGPLRLQGRHPAAADRVQGHQHPYQEVPGFRHRRHAGPGRTARCRRSEAPSHAE